MSRLRDAVRSRWVRRAGAAGFAFFLVKGLAWLAAIGWIAFAADCGRDDSAHDGARSPAARSPLELSARTRETRRL